ncbi:hypothetical protein Tco_1364062 [Tanacetum coccineum]
MLDYGFNFMLTKIHVDNESAICVVKNPVYHSKTKHIEIQHHFIRDSYEKRLIEMVKIHTDYNVADLLTKAFDVTRVKTAKAKHIKNLVGDEDVHKELGDRMERAATTASSLEAEQDSDAQTRFGTTSKSSNDPPLSKVNTFRSGEDMELTATIDGQEKTITEASLRRHLKLEDSDGHTSLPNTEIFKQLALMGYMSDSDRLTFQKGYFSPQWSVHSLGRDEGSVSLNELTDVCTSLSKKVRASENELQQTKKTYSTAITKLIFRDSSKQGRKIFAIDKDPTISLVQPEQEMEHDVGIAKEMTWFQDANAEIKEKNSADTEIILEEEQPTEIVEDIGSGEKGTSEVSTANIVVTTAEVSIAAENLVYIRRSAEKKKDKGKGIMTEPEPKKKIKKQL